MAAPVMPPRRAGSRQLWAREPFTEEAWVPRGPQAVRFDLSVPGSHSCLVYFTNPHGGCKEGHFMHFRLKIVRKDFAMCHEAVLEQTLTSRTQFKYSKSPPNVIHRFCDFKGRRV